MREFILNIESGKIINRKVAAENFRQLTDGKYLVKITSIKKRSLQQNAYYWSCVVPLVMEGLRNAGYDEIKTSEEVHEVMKHLFLKRQVVSKKDGNVIEIAGGTSKLTTTEFSNYLEEIYRWAAEYLGINIPSPGEQLVMLAEYKETDLITLVTEG